MNKIKNKKINLLNIQQFLKNYNLKSNKLNSKNHLYKNNILLKKNDNLSLIELDSYKNYFIPTSNNHENQPIIYNIKTQYENHFLLDFDLNFNFLYYLAQLILKKNQKKEIVKARFIGGTKKKLLISYFGLNIQMKPKNLHQNKRLFYGQKLRSKKIIKYYKLKYLKFKKEIDLNQKSILSRKLYVKEINKKNNK